MFFSPLSLLQEVTSTSESIWFSTQHASFLFLWIIFYQILVNNSFLLLRISSNVFLHFINVEILLGWWINIHINRFRLNEALTFPECFCPNKIPLKTIKNDFYFMVKAPFILEIFTFTYYQILPDQAIKFSQLKAQLCKFENFPLCSHLYKSITLRVIHP